MKKYRIGNIKLLRFLLILGMSIVFLFAAPSAEAVTVDIYDGHGTVGGGAPYSGLVGSFSSADIMFATNTGYAWHPFGLGDFGADIYGWLSVASDGTYTFSLDSDDGSLLFIEGILIVDNGGAHSPRVVSDDVFLTAGIYAFNVQFFEDFGGPSGVDLILPDGVSYVPEPSTLLLLGSGLIGLVGFRRKFKI